ncbi:hypothetical protein E2C01_042801 [Portunus trituberculatus]|uniref:Uncharacterized protein n=1 Tax=Portunus trituberculatus TaxID=210409 RepID=A0A5B7FVL6_PORTR|nr:hypothetical protein [Portunus trituberculatus]
MRAGARKSRVNSIQGASGIVWCCSERLKRVIGFALVPISQSHSQSPSYSASASNRLSPHQPGTT